MSFTERIERLRLTGEDVLGFADIRPSKIHGGNGMIRCPSPDHEDKNPSCSVHLDTGRAHCFVCDWKVGDVVGLHAALAGFAKPGEALRDLEQRRGIDARPRGTEVQTAKWVYREADGEPAFEVVRRQRQLPDGTFERDPRTGKTWKSFRQAHPGGRPHKLPERYRAGNRPLYRLPELLAAPANQLIYVTEGEKAADAICAGGALATTSSGGANQAHLTDWSPLRGRTVVVWPDFDLPGVAYATKVCSLVETIGVVAVDLMNLPVGGDAADYLSEEAP